MQIYLLALNLFALTALGLGLITYTAEERNDRLLPLFLLVITHSLTLILSFLDLDSLDRLDNVSNVLSLLNIVWITWALVGRLPRLGPLPIGVGSGGLAAVVLLPLLPGWSIPVQLHGLVLALGGAFFTVWATKEIGWLSVATLFLLALASFISLVDLDEVAAYTTLLSYALFVGALYRAGLRIYIDRDRVTQDLVQEIYELNRERQRLMDVSEMISNVPNLNHAVEHLVRSLAQAIHVDQAAIFTVDSHARQQAHLLTLYSPHRPFHINDPTMTTFRLINCPPLREAISRRQQLLLPGLQANGLSKLYDLWNEERTGPTLLQPLLVQGNPIGVLMLGNPVSQSPLREADVRLCDHLAAQIAMIVEQRRRYIELENEAKAMTRAVKKQLHEPDEQQKAILEATSDGVIVINAKGRVQFVNHAAEHILGKPGQALIGQAAETLYRQLDSRYPGDDLIGTFARREQPLPTFIEKNERAIQGRLIPWRNKKGEFLGIIAVFRDVTREVRADGARNDFIAALSHELRAPLTVITGYSELLANGLMGDYPPQLREVQHAVYKNAQRIREILDNAIRISAQNRHRVLPRFEEIDVCKIIESTVREILPLVRHHELKVTREIKPDTASIVADPRHVHRILYNLLSNACHFTPPGGRIKLKAWTQLYSWGRDTRPYLFITVADNGIGIPEEEQTRIFDRFYQIKHQMPHKRSSMGLGLTVVKELVELHKGKVWVESEVGQGSVFRVALPTHQEY